MILQPKIYVGEQKIADLTFYFAATNQGLCYCTSHGDDPNYCDKWLKRYYSDYQIEENITELEKYTTQLSAYFNQEIADFAVPFDIKGTPFQLAIWKALCEIPYGKTCTYSDIANIINNPKAVRAVGGAIGSNPVMIFIPCHRVIGKDNSLTGFGGGLPLKEKLLLHEQVLFENSKVF